MGQAFIKDGGQSGTDAEESGSSLGAPVWRCLRLGNPRGNNVAPCGRSGYWDGCRW